MGTAKHDNSYNAVKLYLKGVKDKYPSCKQFILNDPRGDTIYRLGRMDKEIKKLIYETWPKRKAYTIKDCIEKAKLCSSRGEMKVKYAGYYDKVLKNKWQQKVFIKFPINKNYNMISFKECQQIGKKCKNSYDMHKNYPSYYYQCFKYKWLDKIFPYNYIKNGYTYTQCKEKAQNFTIKKDFAKTNPGYYQKSLKMKWIDDICSHMVCGTQARSISFKECLEKAKKCKTKQLFSMLYASHYNRCIKQKWLKNVSQHMIEEINHYEDQSFKKLLKLSEMNAKIICHGKLWKKYRSRPDLIIEINNKLIIIELKDDRSRWTTTHLKKQFDKYNILGEAIFPNFCETIIVSPKGKYGLSFEDLLLYFEFMRLD